MDTLNSNPGGTESASATVPAPVASVPDAAAAPVMTDATITNATPAVVAAPAAPAKPAVPVVNGPLPKTDGKTPGGWNRFAGYDPKAAKNKSNDRGSKGRR